MKGPPKLHSVIFEHLFLRYGAGAHIFRPLTAWKLWNRLCWTLIVLGVIGWMLGLWFLRGYAEPP